MSASRRKKLVRKLSRPARPKPRAKKKTPRTHRGKKAAPAAVVVTPPVASPLQYLLRAAGFAARKHHGQTRADNQTPYFSHVARVTLILSHVFHILDEEILTVALLHDTLEDTATDYDEIAAVFGPQVAEDVVLLTKNVMLPKKEREEDYARRLGGAREAVMIAKMADLYDNLSDRVLTPKLGKTAATAEKFLGIFGPRLRTRLGQAAHEKLAALLRDVKAVQVQEFGPESILTPED